MTVYMAEGNDHQRLRLMPLTQIAQEQKLQNSAIACEMVCKHCKDNINRKQRKLTQQPLIHVHVAVHHCRADAPNLPHPTAGKSMGEKKTWSHWLVGLNLLYFKFCTANWPYSLMYSRSTRVKKGGVHSIEHSARIPCSLDHHVHCTCISGC